MNYSRKIALLAILWFGCFGIVSDVLAEADQLKFTVQIEQKQNNIPASITLDRNIFNAIKKALMVVESHGIRIDDLDKISFSFGESDVSVSIYNSKVRSVGGGYLVKLSRVDLSVLFFGPAA